MRSHSSAAWKTAGRVRCRSVALLLAALFAWMSSAVAAPASGGLPGQHAAVGLSDRAMHHAAPGDCCDEAGAAECGRCAPASACSFCAPLAAVPLGCGPAGSETPSPEAPCRLVGLTVRPPDHPPRFPSAV